MPARPAKVCSWPPMATPRRVSSARPRVMTAALVLSPTPRPSPMPAAMAMTFLSAPPIFAADDVLVGVDAEDARLEHALQLADDRLVVHRDDAGRREPGHDLARQIRAAEHTGRMTGKHLADDLGHAQQRALLEPLRQADDRHPGPHVGPGLLEHGAEAVRRNAHHQHVGGAHRLLHRRRGAQVTAEPRGAEIVRIGAPGVDLLGDLRVARPEHGRAVVGGDRGDGGAP